MNSTNKYLLIIATVFLSWLSAGGLFYFYFNDKITEIQHFNATQHINLPTHSTLPNLSFQPTQDFKTAANNSVNAVVFINTTTATASSMFSDSHDFYSIPQRGTGSGVVFSPDGYIITNHHVIADASKISVTLNNKTEYPATLIAQDPNTDLAVIKIDASDLPTLRFGDSDGVTTGQWVLAVGNPFKLTSTVTAGIVSAKARNIGILRDKISLRKGADYTIESFIQTDAAVNPGNSGGALVSLQGELIGINTAIATETGSYAGYSFAIPSNLVKKIVTDLLQYGLVQRGFIGVSIQDNNQDLAEKYNLKGVQGAVVNAYSFNGAAATAGIQIGDAIVAINNKPTQSASELQEQIANYKPGDTVEVTIIRSQEKHKLSLTLRNQHGNASLLKTKD